LIALILLVLVFRNRRNRSEHASLVPFMDEGRARSVIDVGKGPPPMAGLQHQHVVDVPGQRDQVLDLTGDGSSVRRETGAQARPPAAQQQPASGFVNGESPGTSSSGSSPVPSATYAEHSADSQSRLLPAGKHGRSESATRNTPRHPSLPAYPSHAGPELLVHSDSGLRMNPHSALIELPPSYVE